MKKIVTTVIMTCVFSMLVACGGNSTASLRKKMIDSYVETGFTKEEATELVNELSDEEIEELVNELNSDN